MYTLRIIFQDKTEENFNLGNFYRVITCESEEFKKIKKEQCIISEHLYKFVTTIDNDVYPLFLVDHSYIVSENGATFARL